MVRHATLAPMAHSASTTSTKPPKKKGAAFYSIAIWLLLVDGSPTGTVVAGIDNWVGRVVCGQRFMLNELLDRKDAHRTGIYLLIGESDSDRPRVYIGQSNNISDRLARHQTANEWYWEKACYVTSVDDSFTTAHAKYMESHLYEKAVDALRSEVVNDHAPNPDTLRETDIAFADEFIAKTEFVLPTLGIDYFRPIQIERGADETIFEIKPPTLPIEAQMIVRAGEFIVLRKSKARPVVKRDLYPRIALQQDTLLKNGDLKQVGDSLIFQRDVFFPSANIAANVVLGRHRGSNDWQVLGSDQTYRDWLTKGLPQ